MTPIKIILVLLLVLALRALLVQRSLVAMHRIAALVMFVFLSLLVVFPGMSTLVANRLGVGRGVDLVFYLSHGFLLLLIIGLWRRTVDLSADLTRLARRIAIKNAIEPKE